MCFLSRRDNAIGDISPTELLTSECMLFNKRLFDDNGMAYPSEDALAGILDT